MTDILKEQARRIEALEFKLLQQKARIELLEDEHKADLKQIEEARDDWRYLCDEGNQLEMDLTLVRAQFEAFKLQAADDKARWYKAIDIIREVVRAGNWGTPQWWDAAVKFLKENS